MKLCLYWSFLKSEYFALIVFALTFFPKKILLRIDKNIFLLNLSKHSHLEVLPNKPFSFKYLFRIIIIYLFYKK